MKRFYIAAGCVIILAGIIIAPLPGPGGIPVIALGSLILLRHSPAFRRRFVRFERRWPRAMSPIGRLMRRRRPPRGSE
jgi:uncharacterized membrane protein YbaN (DUF454 family)